MPIAMSTPQELYVTIDNQRSIIERFRTREEARKFSAEYAQVFKCAKPRIVHVDSEKKPGDHI
jgi:hypothetical protein